MHIKHVHEQVMLDVRSAVMSAAGWVFFILVRWYTLKEE